MKKIIYTILTFIVSFVGVFVIYNFVPLKYFEIFNVQKFGATITTILGTDTLSGSRTTINNNFSALNNELSTVTGTTTNSTITTLSGLTTASNLATVGTIISGIWNGTAIGVGYGGTGTTSPTLNQILLGNGSSGLKVVNGLGVSGQFLTSQGTGLPPIWATGTLNLASDYIWTGINTHNSTTTFNATTTIAASSTVGNALNLNTVNYAFPSSQGNASTTLTNDGTGVLTWERADYTLIASTTLTGAVATTTFSIPSSASDLYAIIEVPSVSGGGSPIQIQFNGDTGNNYAYAHELIASGLTFSAQGTCANIALNAENGTTGYMFQLSITNQSNQRKLVSWNGGRPGSGAGAIGAIYIGHGLWNNTSAKINSISVGAGLGGNTLGVGTRISIYSSKK